MKEFLAGNWFALLLGVLCLAGIVYLAVTRQWEKLRGIAYALMLQAERVFSDGEGKKKFDAVFDKLYLDLIPAWLRVFVPPDELRRKLQEWYDLAKDYLDDGVINNK
jgi:Mg2+ and Co2+ transporter CorA